MLVYDYNALKGYQPYREEVISYLDRNCEYYGLHMKEPCYGKVIKDIIYNPSFAEDPTGTVYYVCEGHYECIEGGKYEPSAGL